MARVLFVTFEGLADTVIDSQVLDHARIMRQAGIADFEIIALACRAELYRRSLARRRDAEARAEAPVRVLRGVRPAVPFSEAVNAKRLARAIAAGGTAFDVWHARTDYAAAVCGRLRRGAGTSLIWDCRGDAVAETLARAETAGPATAALLRRRAEALAALRRRAAAACQRAAFVSEPLRDLCADALGDKPSAVVPCAASETAFGFDPELRRTIRAELGYGEDARVFVYSGSLAPYQCFDRVVALFGAIHTAAPRARLLVLCPQTDAARRLAAGLDPAAVRVIAAPFAAVNGYLNAADVAFMLRRKSALNRVASPTKFAEYGLAGLPVVMSDAVPQAHAIATSLGNRLDPAAGAALADTPLPAREAIAAAARARLGKQALVPLYRTLYLGD